MMKRTGAWNEAATVWPTSTAAVDHHPVDGGRMMVWFEVDLGLVDVGLGLAHRRLVGLELGQRRRRSWPAAVSRSLSGSELLREELLGALVLLLRVRDHGLLRGPRWPGPMTRLARAWPRRASKSDGSRRAITWPFFTVGVEVGAQALDGARDLRAHLDRGHGLQGARGPHGFHDVAALEGGGRVLGGLRRRRDRRTTATPAASTSGSGDEWCAASIQRIASRV